MIEVRGAEQLVKLSKELKEAGDKDLQRELAKAINRAAKPAIAAAKQSARSNLPSRGGLADRVASSRIGTRRSRGGLRITAKNASVRGLQAIDQGIVRHPVFGNRDVWVSQSVRPGWWTKPLEGAAPDMRQKIDEAMQDIAKKIDRAV